MTALDRGDLRWQLDFRQLYAEVLEDWLGVDAEPVLGKPGLAFGKNSKGKRQKTDVLSAS